MKIRMAPSGAAKRPRRDAMNTNMPARSAAGASAPAGADPASSAYLSAREAAALLDIKIASLYSYVSRGVIRSVQQPGAKARLYYRDDVDRAKTRMGGRAGIPETMETTVRWGQPMLSSSITEIGAAGPRYRGRPALELAARGRSFESVAELLWTGVDAPTIDRWEHAPIPPEALRRIRAGARGARSLTSLRLITLVNTMLGVSLPPAPDYERGSTVADGRQLLWLYAAAMGHLGPGAGMLDFDRPAPLAETLAIALLGPGAKRRASIAPALNAALVICADHELSPSTLAARVAASAGADLRACVLAAVATHSGALLGGACDLVEQLLLEARSAGELHHRIGALEQAGHKVPGFNLVAYPHGDPRATFLLELATAHATRSGAARRFSGLLVEARDSFDLRPSIEVGLVGLCHALDLPPKSAAAIWVIGRSAGWIAHVIEQRVAGFMIRPRAKYVNLA